MSSCHIYSVSGGSGNWEDEPVWSKVDLRDLLRFSAMRVSEIAYRRFSIKAKEVLSLAARKGFSSVRRFLGT